LACATEICSHRFANFGFQFRQRKTGSANAALLNGANCSGPTTQWRELPLLDVRLKGSAGNNAIVMRATFSEPI